MRTKKIIGWKFIGKFPGVEPNLVKMGEKWTLAGPSLVIAYDETYLKANPEYFDPIYENKTAEQIYKVFLDTYGEFAYPSTVFKAIELAVQRLEPDEVTDEVCEDILEELDEYCTDTGYTSYGLPLGSVGRKAEMVKIIKKHLI